MARRVNTAITGSPESDVDVDAYSYARAIDQTIGDTNLVSDLLTGANAPPANSIVDHSGLDAGSGLYRGVPLGIPIMNTIFPSDRANARQLTDSAATTDVYAVAVPYLLPKGETSLICSMENANFSYDHYFVVLDTSMAEVGRVRMLSSTAADGSYSARIHGKISGLTGGTHYVAAIQTDFGPQSLTRKLLSPRLHFGRRTGPGWMPMVKTVGQADVYELATQAVAGSTIPNFPVIDDARLGVGMAYQANLTTQNALAQNTLDEFLTGSPCGGNANPTLADATADNPVNSAYHSHSRSASFVTEGLVQMPMLALPLGAVKKDGTFITLNPANCNWIPPGLKTAGADKVLLECGVQMPDAPTAAGTSKLGLLLLAANDDANWGGGTTVTVKIDMFTTGGVSAGQRTANIVTASAKWGLAFVQNIAFNSDVINRLRITLNAGALSKADGRACQVVGASLFMEA